MLIVTDISGKMWWPKWPEWPQCPERPDQKENNNPFQYYYMGRVNS